MKHYFSKNELFSFFKNALCVSSLLVALSPSLANAKCTVSDNLVNSCGPWLGGGANDYPKAGSKKDQILALEKRVGRNMEVVHTYHPVGDNQLDSTDLFFINRADTILMTNWKPTKKWKLADGRDKKTNDNIDRMAKSIKAVAPKKVMLVVHHEPEDQVSGEASSCSSYSKKEKAGTPKEYRAMWGNVRKRFDALKVNNVVWVMNYMGYSKWNCMLDDMWPGNHLVDWVMWEAYIGDNDATWPEKPLAMYNYFLKNSNATHDYKSKPWGINEFGFRGSQNHVYKQYENVKKAIHNDIMPRVKMYNIWDSISQSGVDYRAGYDSKGNSDPKEQKLLNEIVKDSFWDKN